MEVERDAELCCEYLLKDTTCVLMGFAGVGLLLPRILIWCLYCDSNRYFGVFKLLLLLPYGDFKGGALCFSLSIG